MSLPQSGFVELVLKRLALRQTELGVRLGKPNAYSAVHAWITGHSKLGYADTMEMLSAAGLLQPEAEAAWRDVSLLEAEALVERARAEAGLALSRQLPDDGEQQTRRGRRTA